MAKYHKKKVTMIDMTARLNVEIVPGTEEESRKLEKEIDEMSKRIEEKSERYRRRLHQSILEMLAKIPNDDVNPKSKHPDYVEKYRKLNRKTFSKDEG